MHNFAKLIVLQLLRAYKWAISPMFPPACRYQPTCSEYAMEAVDRYGVLHGSLMSIVRLLRCHPFAHGGYDPVVKKGACAAETTAFRLQPERIRAPGDQCVCVIPKARAFTSGLRDLAWTIADPSTKKMNRRQPTANDQRREDPSSCI